MTILIESDLSEEQRIVFMEVIEESLRVTNKTHLFNWLQHGMQYLIGHDLIVYGVRIPDSEHFEFDYLTTSLQFTDTHFHSVINKESGMIHQAINQWEVNSNPLSLTSDLPSKEHANFDVLNIFQAQIQASEIGQCVLHGFGDVRTSTSTIVMLGRMNTNINELTAYLLKLFMPYLHCALIKVHSKQTVVKLNTNQEFHTKALTKREIELLQWLHMGKTNWEISTILQISPTTVKNHVQNIIRKLAVENRSQAAIKGLKLGLISIQQPRNY